MEYMAKKLPYNHTMRKCEHEVVISKATVLLANFAEVCVSMCQIKSFLCMPPWGSIHVLL